MKEHEVTQDETSRGLDALGSHERGLASEGLEGRVASRSFAALASARAGGVQRVIPTAAGHQRWRVNAGLRLAAGVAVAALIGTALVGRNSGQHSAASADPIAMTTDAEWALVFASTGADELMTDAERLSESFGVWSPEETLSIEGAM